MAAKDPTSLLTALCRMYWMMIGPMVLVLTASSIVSTGNGWLTVADFGFLGALTGMALARWLEFQGGNPTTSEGEPATAKHLRRYLITVATVGCAVWVVANVVGNYVLPGS